MISPNPFTPKSGQEPKVFLNRDEEISFFKKKITELEQGKQNHYILNGVWGSGKTSLLKHFKHSAQSEGYAAAYFPIQEFHQNTEDTVITVHMLQSIARSLSLGFSKKSNFIQSLEGFGIQILGSGFNVHFNVDKNKIVDSQTLLLDGLINIWKDVQQHKGIVVLIDDAQNFSEVHRYLTTLKNVLSMDEIIKDTKYLFILSSTIDGWTYFMKKNHPIGRFFIPRLELKFFNEEHTYTLIEKTLQGTGVTFDKELYPFVWETTQGHLFEIHSLCEQLYELQENMRVDYKKSKIALFNTLNYLGNTLFEQRLLDISNHENKILYVLSHFNKQVSVKEIQEKLKKRKTTIAGVHQYVRRLVEKGLIDNRTRGMYCIEDVLFRLYIQTLFEDQ